MGFNIQKFLSQPFSARTKNVSVPAMKAFFPEKEEPQFTVRGLEGAELAQVHEAVKIQQGIEKIMEKIVSPNLTEKVEAMRKAIGITDNVPGETVRRLEMLVRGSVEPKVTLDLAVKICEIYPIEFYLLTNTITELTGQGKEPGKQKPSGKKRK